MLLLWAAASPCALAQDAGRPAAFVALQPLPATPPADIDSLLALLWKPYFQKPGDLGFDHDQIRAGRIDLDEDGQAELVLLLEAPAWQTESGGLLLVARWSETGWKPIGWAYGERDGVVVTTERLGGWATIETQSQLLRWNGKAYVTTNIDR
jgi:hypothetical protein